MTPAEIIAILEAKAQAHPELAAPLDWTGFRTILAREDVALLHVPLARSGAQLKYFDGAWTILLNSGSPVRRHLWDGVHELGHLWLHARGIDSIAARQYHSFSYEEAPDPQEDEAEIFAAMLLGSRHFWRVF
jgi:Zn-dependent peptidase ImmA (M78 family)